MKKNSKNIWFLHFTKIVFFAIVLFAINFSCKNEDEEESVDDLPVFGTCVAVATAGGLSQSASDSTITYITSGGGKIVMDQKGFFISITHRDYPNFKLDFWGTVERNGKNAHGANHENLNGKHIKDREGTRRSIIFPDGTKLTMDASNIGYELLSATIYDGQQCHHFNAGCNTLEYSSANSAFTKQLDDAEADGETGTFEITQTGLLFNNIYNEKILGQKVEKLVPLGEIFKAEPNRVNDYYDDTSLGHT